MNLIEQFGGYEKVKSIRDINIREFDGDASGVTIHYMGNSITQEDLEKALLEYRRHHNIFEVGDKVVYLDEPILRSITDIQTIKSVGKKSVWAYKKDGYNFATEVYFFQIRHATDAEIKAGRRL